jgi:CheY-like chemotaxis protein
MAKVLLSEDDDFSRDMLARRLQRSGYEVVAAPDGRAAVEAALHHRPDVIVMDLDMPVMDGRTAMKLLQNDVRTFRIPIIVVTAHTGSEDVAAALSAGCFAFEAKPIVLRRLIERIEEAMQSTGRKRAAGSPAEDVQPGATPDPVSP